MDVIGRRIILLFIAVSFAVSTPVIAEQRYGPVKFGEGVYSIAAQFRDKSGDLNLRQWALAIYSLNPDAFAAGLDSLQIGAMLRIPDEAQVRRSWRAGKAALAGAPLGIQAVPVPALAPAISAAERHRVLEPELPSDLTPLGEGAGPQVGSGRRSSRPDPLITDFEREFVLLPQVPENLSAPPVQAFGLTEEAADPPAAAAQGSDLPEVTPLLPGLLAETAEDQDAGEAFVNTALYTASLQAIELRDHRQMLPQLRELEERFAGDADFDYVYGVSLLDSGYPAEALYPLLRAHHARPADLGIELDLGRAYFETGENETARAVFNRLAASDPPRQAALVIASYLDAGRRRAARYERYWSAALALKGGFDSNANGASDLSDFIGFTLDENARSAESPYSELDAQAEISVPLSARWYGVIGAQAQTRQYTDTTELSTSQGGLSSSLNYRRGNWQLASSLSASQAYVDGQVNSTYASLGGSWTYANASPWRYSSSIKYGLARYEGSLLVRNVNQALLALGVTRRTGWGSGSELGVNLLAGQDEAQEPGSPYGRDLLGLGAQFTSQLNVNWMVDSHAQFLRSAYAGAFFGLEREDQQWSAGIGIRHAVPRWTDWQLRLAASYLDNRSDVGIYSYDRIDAALSLSRQFD